MMTLPARTGFSEVSPSRLKRDAVGTGVAVQWLVFLSPNDNLCENKQPAIEKNRFRTTKTNRAHFCK